MKLHREHLACYAGKRWTLDKNGNRAGTTVQEDNSSRAVASLSGIRRSKAMERRACIVQQTNSHVKYTRG